MKSGLVLEEIVLAMIRLTALSGAVNLWALSQVTPKM